LSCPDNTTLNSPASLEHSGTARPVQGFVGGFFYPTISKATQGTTLKTMTKILNIPMKQTNATLNASLEIEKNLLFIRKEKSAKKMHIMEVKLSNPRFKIVHHIKNVVST
jgi:hypothetical protein